MIKICCVVYGADDKNKVTFSDTGDVRIINCSFRGRQPGAFAIRKIRKLCGSAETVDSLGIAVNPAASDPKCIFRRDIAVCIEEYAARFGINPAELEIAVYGAVSSESIRRLTEMFRMVWLFGNSADEYTNAFSPSKPLKTDVAVYAADEYETPAADLIFNLTDKNITAVDNIGIVAEGLGGIGNELRQPVVMKTGMPYRITDFQVNT